MRVLSGLMLTMGLAASAHAQSAANPVVSSAQEVFAKESQYMTEAAAQMPEAKYGYHPTPSSGRTARSCRMSSSRTTMSARC